jgi:hypothetical protein
MVSAITIGLFAILIYYGYWITTTTAYINEQEDTLVNSFPITFSLFVSGVLFLAYDLFLITKFLIGRFHY